MYLPGSQPPSRALANLVLYEDCLDSNTDLDGDDIAVTIALLSVQGLMDLDIAAIVAVAVGHDTHIVRIPIPCFAALHGVV